MKDEVTFIQGLIAGCSGNIKLGRFRGRNGAHMAHIKSPV